MHFKKDHISLKWFETASVNTIYQKNPLKHRINCGHFQKNSLISFFIYIRMIALDILMLDKNGNSIGSGIGFY